MRISITPDLLTKGPINPLIYDAADKRALTQPHARRRSSEESGCAIRRRLSRTGAH